MLQKPCIPIITDTSLYPYTGSVFGETQAYPIKNDKKYFRLRETIEEHVEITPPGHDESSDIARKFRRKMNKLEPLLGVSAFVGKADLDAIKVKLSGVEKDRDEAENQLSELQDQYDVLYKTKTVVEAMALTAPTHNQLRTSEVPRQNNDHSKFAVIAMCFFIILAVFF